jgi:hypothetical protein
MPIAGAQAGGGSRTSSSRLLSSNEHVDECSDISARGVHSRHHSRYPAPSNWRSRRRPLDTALEWRYSWWSNPCVACVTTVRQSFASMHRSGVMEVAGFTGSNVPRPRMEEEDDPGLALGFRPPRSARARVFADETTVDSESSEVAAQRVNLLNSLSTSLLEERGTILKDAKFSPREKVKLLEANRRVLLNVSGGSTTKTENVVYGLIIFASVTTVVLASLTTFAGLPSEVALAFISTVAGGLIATVAQKIRQL